MLSVRRTASFQPAYLAVRVALSSFGSNRRPPVQGTTSSNATGHLATKHQVLSDKTVAYKKNVKALQSIIEHANPGYQMDPSRFLTNAFAIAAAQSGVPNSFFKSAAWAIAMHHVGTGRRIVVHIDELRMISNHSKVGLGWVEVLNEVIPRMPFPYDVPTVGSHRLHLYQVGRP